MHGGQTREKSDQKQATSRYTIQVYTMTKKITNILGKVIEKNEKVEELPAVINSSAEDEGWLFKIELSDPEELKSLMDREKYDHYLKSQEEDH